MKIILLAEAQRRIEAEDAWWREHRDAKELFVDEFVAALKRIAELPHTGQHYRRTEGKLVQRMLMRKTACHVYYHVDRAREVIEVHTIWGAHKRHGPDV